MKTKPAVLGLVVTIVLFDPGLVFAQDRPASEQPAVSNDERHTAQRGPSTGTSEQRPAPAFKLFRYDEDYRYLVDPSQRTHPLDRLKYVALSSEDADTYLTLSGEARTRYEYTSAPGFGLLSREHNDYVLQRLLLGGDFHAGRHVRVFTQLVSGLDGGPELPPPATQQDKLDLQQAFADVLLGDTKDPSLRLRAGRMEMGYGSYRLVSPRDGTNIRLNFDGARATLTRGGSAIDAFLTHPVEQRHGHFDDGDDKGETFWGVYAAMPISRRTSGVDAYYFGLHRQQAALAAGTTTEDRHTVGTRLWGASAGIDYDIEGAFQFGTSGDLDIVAWGVATHMGYTFEQAAWSPRLALKANVASGDTNPRDRTLGTFYSLFPKYNYFSDAGLLAPANFFDLHPSLRLRPRDAVFLTLEWDPYWRYSIHDAVYAPGRIAIPGSASSARYVGSTVSAQVDWKISTYASISLNCTHFFAGDVVHDALGRDVDFAALWMTLRF